MATDQKRKVVEVMCKATGRSQRRACRLAGLILSPWRCSAQRHADVQLYLRISELVLEHHRFDYRHIWQLLRREDFCVNHWRAYRICHLNGLSLKRRGHHNELATERLPILRSDALNLTWSMDFVMDELGSGSLMKCLTCVDDFTRECLTITAAFGTRGVQMTRILDSIGLFRGYPTTIKPERGPGIYLPRA